MPGAGSRADALLLGPMRCYLVEVYNGACVGAGAAGLEERRTYLRGLVKGSDHSIDAPNIIPCALKHAS